MKLHTTFAAAALLALALSGCASDVPLHKAPVESINTSGGAAAGAEGANAAGVGQNGYGQSQVAPVQAGATSATGPGPGPEVARSVYFDYNSYVVDDKYRAVISANADYLNAHPQAHVQLQGNTDARGSREYNLALGQKRAEAVMQGLNLLGVKSDQMEAVSFGKEKPLALGSSEADYAKNRRVDLVYK